MVREGREGGVGRETESRKEKKGWEPTNAGGKHAGFKPALGHGLLATGGGRGGAGNSRIKQLSWL